MEKTAGLFQLDWNWEITSLDLEGNILMKEKVHNLIVDEGLNMVRDLLGGFNSQGPVIGIAIGTGATAPVNGNTVLQSEFVRAASVNSSPANFQVEYTYTFSFASGVSQVITEAGLFDNAVSGGNMLARTTFSGQLVNHSIQLIVTAIITISRV